MIDAIVPAYNEETTVKAVVNVLVRSGLFGSVIVVNDGSTDETAAQAREGGADVLTLTPNQGKMAAMMAGVFRSTAPALAFFDADAENLSAEHVAALIECYRSGDCAQVCGVIDQGLLNRTRIATGQRIVARDVLERIPITCEGYSAETVINFLSDRTGIATRTVELTGLRYRHKVDKFGVVSGTVQNARMVAGMVGAHVALNRSGGGTCRIADTIRLDDVAAVLGGVTGGSFGGAPGALAGSSAGRVIGSVGQGPGIAVPTWKDGHSRGAKRPPGWSTGTKVGVAAATLAGLAGAGWFIWRKRRA